MKKALLSIIVLTRLLTAYSQLSVRGDSLVSLPGRQVQLSKQGFPEQIYVPDTLLAENVHFHFTRQPDGKDIRLIAGGVHFTRKETDKVEWSADNVSDELRVEINASLGADGRIGYRVRVTALQDVDLKEIAMHIPFRPDTKWDPAHTGLQYSLEGSSWSNEGKGGTTVGIKGKSMLVNNYSGARYMRKGDTLYYNFHLVVK